MVLALIIHDYFQHFNDNYVTIYYYYNYAARYFLYKYDQRCVISSEGGGEGCPVRNESMKCM